MRYKERLESYERKLGEHQDKLAEYEGQLREKREQGKSTKGLEKRISSKRKAIKTQRERIRKLKATHKDRMAKLRERLENRKERDRQAIEKLGLQIKAQEETRDYNLGTSLKSYVDPRIYYDTTGAGQSATTGETTTQRHCRASSAGSSKRQRLRTESVTSLASSSKADGVQPRLMGPIHSLLNRKAILKD